MCTAYKCCCLLADAGKLNATGSGAGQGYSINIPLPGDSGHDSMLAVWQRVIEPAAHRFQPDIILCSAGRGLCLSAGLHSVRQVCLASDMLCGVQA